MTDFIQMDTCWMDCRERHCTNKAAAHDNQEYCTGCAAYYEEAEFKLRLDQMTISAIYSKAFFNNVEVTPQLEYELFGVETPEMKQARLRHEIFVQDPHAWLNKATKNLEGG